MPHKADYLKPKVGAGQDYGPAHEKKEKKAIKSLTKMHQGVGVGQVGRPAAPPARTPGRIVPPTGGKMPRRPGGRPPAVGRPPGPPTDLPTHEKMPRGVGVGQGGIPGVWVGGPEGTPRTGGMPPKPPTGGKMPRRPGGRGGRIRAPEMGKPTRRGGGMHR